MTEPEKRVCRRCGDMKAFPTAFPLKSSRGKSYYGHTCILCESAKDRARRKKGVQRKAGIATFDSLPWRGGGGILRAEIERRAKVVRSQRTTTRWGAYHATDPIDEYESTGCKTFPDMASDLYRTTRNSGGVFK